VAHIQRLAKNRWRARYVAPDGRERSRTFERKVDAELFVASVETDKVRGAWVDPRLSKTTFGEWAASWRSTVVHLKPKTRTGYDSPLRTLVLPEFGQTPWPPSPPFASRGGSQTSLARASARRGCVRHTSSSRW